MEMFKKRIVSFILVDGYFIAKLDYICFFKLDLLWRFLIRFKRKRQSNVVVPHISRESVFSTRFERTRAEHEQCGCTTY